RLASFYQLLGGCAVLAKNCALYVSKNCAVLLAEKCVLYLTIYNPFEKAVFKHWFLKTLVMPEEICLILSETNLESDYLWDHAFHTVLQQSLQTIFFDLMQALNMDE
uniref:hypothetical protein n=1 Tax=Butyricicoccus sp. Marseille-Q5471 TaxID=3039493 RepID=UPI0024BCC13C